MKKQMLSILLVLCMVLSMVPMTAFAAAGNTFTIDNLTYTVTKEDSGGNEVDVYTSTFRNNQSTVIYKASSHENPQLSVDDFTDVQENDWFYESVKTATEKGWFTGISDTSFAPNLNITRGMIVTVLHRMENKPGATAASGFEDVESGAYYADGVNWAQENGIVSGYGNGKFGSQDNITREQMVSILYRYAQKLKGLELVTSEENLIGFADSGSISEYAVSAMNWAVGEGLISGKGNGILDSKGYATRAESAAILTRLDALFSEK